MIELIVCLLLAGLVCWSVSMLKIYHHIPAKELRRRSRAGDKYAAGLYKVAGYGVGLDVFLWLLVGVSSTVLFYMLSRSLAWWGSLPLVLFIIWFAFAWIPARRTMSLTNRTALISAPALARILGVLHPVISLLAVRIGSLRPLGFHTGLFEKEDLIDLLGRQSSQVDNRISPGELKVARGALTFADKTVREVMTPKRIIRFVQADEPISPVLMDELHASGFSRFPVIEPQADNAEHVVGTLYIKDLLDKHQGGSVRAVMSKDVFYVNEEQDLLQALDAFIKTKHHLFVVVNNFEEIVGVLSIEDVFEQILGRHVMDEFDQYDDLRSVAMQMAKKDRKGHSHPVPQDKTEQPQDKKADEPPQTVVK